MQLVDTKMHCIVDQRIVKITPFQSHLTICWLIHSNIDLLLSTPRRLPLSRRLWLYSMNVIVNTTPKIPDDGLVSIKELSPLKLLPIRIVPLLLHGAIGP